MTKLAYLSPHTPGRLEAPLAAEVGEFFAIEHRLLFKVQSDTNNLFLRFPTVSGKFATNDWSTTPKSEYRVAWPIRVNLIARGKKDLPSIYNYGSFVVTTDRQLMVLCKNMMWIGLTGDVLGHMMHLDEARFAYEVDLVDVEYTPVE